MTRSRRTRATYVHDAALQPRRLRVGATQTLVTLFIVAAVACTGESATDSPVPGEDGVPANAGDGHGDNSGSGGAGAGERTMGTGGGTAGTDGGMGGGAASAGEGGARNSGVGGAIATGGTGGTKSTGIGGTATCQNCACASIGDTCSATLKCCSGTCAAGTCVCEGHEDCDPTHEYKPTWCEQGACVPMTCGTPGKSCQDSNECCTGVCDGGACTCDDWLCTYGLCLSATECGGGVDEG